MANNLLAIAAVIILIGSSLASDERVYLGTSVDLECVSKTPIDCNWKCNGMAMDIDNEAYHYLHSNGSYTTHCSIQIHFLKEKDVGNWTCWSLSTDKTEGHLLNSLSLEKKLTHHTNNTNPTLHEIPVKIGWSIVLSCNFDTIQEECHWLRNDQPVFIVNRYKFVNYNGSGSDCSINITSVQIIDIGSWHCTTSGNNVYGYISSNVSWLTPIEEIPHSMRILTQNGNFIYQHPGDVYVEIGDTVTLPCMFREPVHCTWFRKGQVIHVDDRYRYAANQFNASKLSNCTLIVSSILLSDVGDWRCIGSGDDANYAIISKKSIISLKQSNALPTLRFPESTNHVHHVKYGEDVNLKCKFSEKANCDWARNEKSIKISNRYNHNFESSKGEGDCSLTIHSANAIDAGNWTCRYKSNLPMEFSPNSSYTHSVFLVPADPEILMNTRITDYTSPEQLMDTNNTVVCISETVNSPPNISWIIDGISIPGRYESDKVGDNLYVGRLYWNASTRISLGNHTYRYLSKNLHCKVGEHSESKLNIVDHRNLLSWTDRKPHTTNYMPSSEIYEIAKSTILRCIFNQPVNCFWETNGKQADSTAYEYIDQAQGVDTTNCSIAIRFAKELINTRWTCSQLGSYGFGSRETTLKGIEAPTLPIFQLNGATVQEIFLPEILRMNTYRKGQHGLVCSSESGYPAPTLIAAEAWSKMTSYRSISVVAYIDMRAIGNKSFINCSLEHPFFSSPPTATLLIKRHNSPSHPVITINGTLIKSDVTLPMHDGSTEITCACDNGYPGGNLFWDLDGQILPGRVEQFKNGEFSVMSTLQWKAAGFEIFNQSKQLRCAVEHPAFEETHFANESIYFIYNTPTEPQIYLNNKDEELEEGTSISFQCMSNRPVSCTMKLNSRTMEDIPATSSVTSSGIIAGHDIEQSILHLPHFKEKHVGKWQCCCSTTEGRTELTSQEVSLSIFNIPMGPDIVLDQTRKAISEMIIKNHTEFPRINCITRFGNPAATLQWTLNGNHITDQNMEEQTQMLNSNSPGSLPSYSTRISWNSPFNLSETNTAAILQCTAFHPGYENKSKSTKLIITMQKTPDNPVIVFKEKVLSKEVSISQPEELNLIKCICANGNPSPKLYWQVNDQGMGGIYKNILIRLGLNTAKLHWDPTYNKYLVKGSIQLTCISTHPGFGFPRSSSVRVVINSD